MGAASRPRSIRTGTSTRSSTGPLTSRGRVPAAKGSSCTAPRRGSSRIALSPRRARGEPPRISPTARTRSAGSRPARTHSPSQAGQKTPGGAWRKGTTTLGGSPRAGRLSLVGDYVRVERRPVDRLREGRRWLHQGDLLEVLGLHKRGVGDRGNPGKKDGGRVHTAFPPAGQEQCGTRSVRPNRRAPVVLQGPRRRIVGGGHSGIERDATAGEQGRRNVPHGHHLRGRRQHPIPGGDTRDRGRRLQVEHGERGQLPQATGLDRG